ncbi:hypothetical protein HPB47_016335 [Ixodes persulcatus]|uniref:Uncharacterized protein n=1 Tax=Ixodes persulcatus TaxID=34615 RepID=A0AC60QSE5_IXOPE|nr:hypothetical protein HPB47_016335 [Ixodes persulcatus]
MRAVWANEHNSKTVLALETSVHQTTRFVSHIANRHHGMKEHNLVRLVQDFVLNGVTPTDRYILDSLGIAHPRNAPTKVALPPAIRESIHIPPIPKNMHSVHNLERRRARAKALHKQYEKSEDVVYVDAADYAAAPGRRITQVEHWETVLLNSDPADQNWAIQLAEDAARAKGLLADA